MRKEKTRFAESLPDFIQDMEARRETSREISRKLVDIKKYWQAMLKIPEIAEKAKDIDVACEYELLIADIDMKITDVQSMPLPAAEKAKLIADWKEIRRQVQVNGEKLVEAVDYFPCGYLSIENNSPESVTIKPIDRQQLEEEGATIAVPQEAKELYEQFMKVVRAAEEWENYQYAHNLNIRDFVSTYTHISSAEDFAKNWLKGTWKRLNYQH